MRRATYRTLLALHPPAFRRPFAGAADVAPLDLRQDGSYGRLHRYIDVLNTPPEPALADRALVLLRKAAVAAVGSAWLPTKESPSCAIRCRPTQRRIKCRQSETLREAAHPSTIVELGLVTNL